ncbi:MAG: hypothetical protein ACW975_00690 [Candidatus Thorarchaeota archaeon]|jgi:hypothetical protein
MTENKFKNFWAFPLLIGMVYLLGGLLWFIASIGVPIPFPSALDPISSLMLVIVSVVFLAAVKPLHRNERQGFAFIAVGMFLAGVLFMIQLLILSTNYLGWILGFEDWLAWTMMSDITPTVWLFLFALITFAVTRATEGDADNGLTKHVLGEV